MNKASRLFAFFLFTLVQVFLFSCEKENPGNSNNSASLGLPIVSTTTVTEISNMQAKSGGNISSDGGKPILKRGVCWGLTKNPTIDSLSKTIDGSGVGEFTSIINGLFHETTYYVRAYATNENGTSYGPELSFKTLSTPQGSPIFEILNASSVIQVNNSSVTIQATISSDGGLPISQRGFCWSSTQINPTIDLPTKSFNGAGTGQFLQLISGLSNNTTYYVRAHASNDSGTFYGNTLIIKTLEGSSSLPVIDQISSGNISEIKAYSAIITANISSEGSSPVLSRGFCWSNSIQDPTIFLTTKTMNGVGTGSFTGTISGLSPNTTYFIRPYASNDSGVVYGNVISFSTLATRPSLSTTPVSSIKSSSAICGGIVFSDGGTQIINKGICWGTNSEPTIEMDSKTVEGSGLSNFISSMNGLNPYTTYYVRSYATNSAGTSYGINVVKFRTKTAFTVSDFQGNEYSTVTIGSQIWMKENLKTAFFKNGDPIASNLTDNQWKSATSSASAAYQNNAENIDAYGLLYNGYAVTDPRGLCPNGWHIPSPAEWESLINFLGGYNLAGGKLKSLDSTSVGFPFWSSGNTGATNSSGFNGLPAGWRSGDTGYFFDRGLEGTFWAMNSGTYLNNFQLLYWTGQISQWSKLKTFGYSVRCVKD
jgi:uncharacterized protein (TIGR02145 family)